ncbi:hypothetical protein EBR25_14530, partial [bacterium]|nr:hypothetical protein [bacterium]
MEDKTDMHYDPPGQPERLATRAKIPRQPLGLNKRAIVVAACIVGGVIGVVIISAFTPSPPSELPKAETTWSPHPSEVVQSLPNDYDEMERKRREEERRKQFTQRASVGEKTVKSATPSQEEKILLEYEVTRLKQAINARESDLEFKGAYQQVRAFRGTQQGSSYGAQASGAGKDVSGLSNTGAFNPRDDDNRQDEKRGFLSEARDEKTHLSGRVRSAASRYELMAGTVIPGLMVTGVNSDLPGQVVGQISEHVYDSADGRYLLIPQ